MSDESRKAMAEIERLSFLCQDLRRQNEALKAQAEEYRVGRDRYETLRLLNPHAFTELYALHLRGTKPFDQMVDELKPLVRPAAPRGPTQ